MMDDDTGGRLIWATMNPKLADLWPPRHAEPYREAFRAVLAALRDAGQAGENELAAELAAIPEVAKLMQRRWDEGVLDAVRRLRNERNDLCNKLASRDERIAELEAERDALAARINPDGAPVDVAALCVEIDEAATRIAELESLYCPDYGNKCVYFNRHQDAVEKSSALEKDLARANERIAELEHERRKVQEALYCHGPEDMEGAATAIRKLAYELTDNLARVKAESLRVMPVGDSKSLEELWGEEWIIRHDGKIYFREYDSSNFIHFGNDPDLAGDETTMVQPVRLERWEGTE